MKLIACVECGAPIVKRGNTRYCADCARRIRRRRHTERQRRQRADRRAAAPPSPTPATRKTPAPTAPPPIVKRDRPTPTARTAHQPKGVDFLLEDAAGNVYHVRAYLIRRVPVDLRAAVRFRLRGMIALAQQTDL